MRNSPVGQCFARLPSLDGFIMPGHVIAEVDENLGWQASVNDCVSERKKARNVRDPPRLKAIRGPVRS